MRSDMFFCGAAGCVTFLKAGSIMTSRNHKNAIENLVVFQKIRLHEIECWELAKKQMVVFLLVERTGEYCLSPQEGQEII